ncbi:MAG: hypothetical protein WD646_13295 [Actinomycetota bacterium]
MLKRATVTTVLVIAALGGLVSVARAEPTCTTFDDRNQPAKTFRGGDGIIVRGTGFGTQSTAVVSFRQGVRTAELARVNTTDLGAFSTLDSTKIPATTERGPGSIVVVDGPLSATCDITLAGSAAPDEDSSSPTALYIVWGLVLAVVAGFLVFVTLRRWQAARLKRAMAELAAKPESDWLEVARVPADAERQRSPRVPWLELDDVEIVEVESPDLEPKRRRRKKDAPEDFLLEDDEVDDAPLDDESDDDFDLDDDFELDESPETPAPRSKRKGPVTPPRLSAEELKTPPKRSSAWERGRVRPKRSTSRSVDRLRDEVKGWRTD